MDEAKRNEPEDDSSSEPNQPSQSSLDDTLKTDVAQSGPSDSPLSDPPEPSDLPDPLNFPQLDPSDSPPSDYPVSVPSALSESGSSKLPKSEPLDLQQPDLPSLASPKQESAPSASSKQEVDSLFNALMKMDHSARRKAAFLEQKNSSRRPFRRSLSSPSTTSANRVSNSINLRRPHSHTGLIEPRRGLAIDSSEVLQLERGESACTDSKLLTPSSKSDFQSRSVHSTQESSTGMSQLTSSNLMYSTSTSQTSSSSGLLMYVDQSRIAVSQDDASSSADVEVQPGPSNYWAQISNNGLSSGLSSRLSSGLSPGTYSRFSDSSEMIITPPPGFNDPVSVNGFSSTASDLYENLSSQSIPLTSQSAISEMDPSAATTPSFSMYEQLVSEIEPSIHSSQSGSDNITRNSGSNDQQPMPLHPSSETHSTDLSSSLAIWLDEVLTSAERTVEVALQHYRRVMGTVSQAPSLSQQSQSSTSSANLADPATPSTSQQETVMLAPSSSNQVHRPGNNSGSTFLRQARRQQSQFITISRAHTSEAATSEASTCGHSKSDAQSSLKSSMESSKVEEANVSLPTFCDASTQTEQRPSSNMDNPNNLETVTEAGTGASIGAGTGAGTEAGIEAGTGAGIGVGMAAGSEAGTEAQATIFAQVPHPTTAPVAVSTEASARDLALAAAMATPAGARRLNIIVRIFEIARNLLFSLRGRARQQLTAEQRSVESTVEGPTQPRPSGSQQPNNEESQSQRSLEAEASGTVAYRRLSSSAALRGAGVAEFYITPDSVVGKHKTRASKAKCCEGKPKNK